MGASFRGFAAGKPSGNIDVAGTATPPQGGVDHRVVVYGMAEGLPHPQVVERRLEGVHHQVSCTEGHVGVQLVPEPRIRPDTVDFRLVGQRDVVHFPRLVGGQHGWLGRDVEQPGDHPLQIGLVGPPVEGIRLQHDAVQLRPFHQRKGTAAQ